MVGNVNDDDAPPPQPEAEAQNHPPAQNRHRESSSSARHRANLRGEQHLQRIIAPQHHNNIMARRHGNNLDLGNNFVFFHQAPHLGGANEPPSAPRLPRGDDANNGNQGDAPSANDNRNFENEIAYVVNEDGVIEGGVAVASHIGSYLESNGGGSGRTSRDCDLVLLIEVAENLQSLPHSVAKRGATIAIGLDKTTKLHAVFRRFAEFCTLSSHNKEPIDQCEIEFVHNDILQDKETAESSALMKNDRIRVRKKRAHEREEHNERQRLQRDSDRTYFKHLRCLLPDLTSGGTCDVVLDCRGRLLENGMEQMVLSTAVKAHSAIVSRRCPWLGDKIRIAREKLILDKSIAVVNRIPSDTSPTNNMDTVPGMRISDEARAVLSRSSTMDGANEVAAGGIPAGVSPSCQRKVSGYGNTFKLNVSPRLENDDDDEDDDSAGPYPMRHGSEDHKQDDQSSHSTAAKVVAEEDDLSASPSNLIANDGPCCAISSKF
mmetsp:Transcript_50215/g.60596  ORF Transcript_50215/g.60596 Transcript_50215/m.60596 type:complete len:490 (-) Transcript_50215:57-1526(-)